MNCCWVVFELLPKSHTAILAFAALVDWCYFCWLNVETEGTEGNNIIVVGTNVQSIENKQWMLVINTLLLTLYECLLEPIIPIIHNHFTVYWRFRYVKDSILPACDVHDSHSGSWCIISSPATSSLASSRTHYQFSSLKQYAKFKSCYRCQPIVDKKKVPKVYFWGPCNEKWLDEIIMINDGS